MGGIEKREVRWPESVNVRVAVGELPRQPTVGRDEESTAVF
jgi:hypothetical protein